MKENWTFRVFDESQIVILGPILGPPNKGRQELIATISGINRVPNAHLISRAPAMLRLLEKVWPIIEAEAEHREFVIQSPDFLTNLSDDEKSYYSEMRELANEIKAEINRAYGREPQPTEDPHTGQLMDALAELCPHGYGFVEYCPDCKDRKNDNEELQGEK